MKNGYSFVKFVKKIYFTDKVLTQSFCKVKHADQSYGDLSFRVKRESLFAKRVFDIFWTLGSTAKSTEIVADNRYHKIL